MPKAIETLKKALSVDRRGWVPYSSTLTACLDYLEGQGDVEGIEEIISLLKNLINTCPFATANTPEDGESGYGNWMAVEPMRHEPIPAQFRIQTGGRRRAGEAGD
ncbi:hypothetical protein ACE6H2_010968 [Prunus campanulata]